MIRALKSLQLMTSMAVLLFSLSYPGVMVVITSAIGIVYVAAAIGSMRDSLVAIWLAFIFSLLAATYSTPAVVYIRARGFDFLTGEWPHHDGFDVYPYLFLVISCGSIVVVILHVASWPWMLGRKQRNVESPS